MAPAPRPSSSWPPPPPPASPAVNAATAPAHADPGAGDGTRPLVPWDDVDRFVGQFAHDLRNGLNALELQATLLSELVTDPELTGEVRALRKTVHRLSRDLQTTRAAFAPVTITRVPGYPVLGFLEDLRERWTEQRPADAAAVRWDWTAGALGEATFAVDPDQLMHAVWALLDNAVCFRAPAVPLAPADFRARLRGGGPTVAGTDRGSGEDGVQLTLWEPQAAPRLPGPGELAAWGCQPLRSTRRGGYGLGLFTARRVVAAHGGTFHATVFPNEPALVTVIELPRETSPGTPAPGAVPSSPAADP